MSPNEHEAFAHRGKRVKFSSDDSSENSRSDASALVPTSAGEQSTDASDCGSDSESELFESSEEPSDDSSSEEEGDDGSDDELGVHQGQDGVVHLRATRGKKPVMKLDKEEIGPDIREFLKEFLPQLEAANEELEAQKKAGTLQSLDVGAGEDDELYIEMDLGLGVLEAKEPNGDQNSDSDSNASTEGNDEKEKDILGKLMGRDKTAIVAGIEVIHSKSS